jgi:hypothetical protein
MRKNVGKIISSFVLNEFIGVAKFFIGQVLKVMTKLFFFMRIFIKNFSIEMMESS